MIPYFKCIRVTSTVRPGGEHVTEFSIRAYVNDNENDPIKYQGRNQINSIVRNQVATEVLISTDLYSTRNKDTCHWTDLDLNTANSTTDQF